MRPGLSAIPTLFVAAAVLTASPAAAQPHPLRHDDPLDVTVTTAGGAAWLASALLLPLLAPEHCHWCAGDGVDIAARDALVWRHPSAADILSDVTAFALVPLATMGLDALAANHDGAPGSLGHDSLILLETTVLATDVNQLTKMLVGRQRPFVYARAQDPNAVPHPKADDNLSFFSGHTTEVFALAASAGTVASLRGYRWAPLVWATGMTLAATTGYLRIAADEHWLTDVLVGMLVGAGLGVGLPLAFHGRDAGAMGGSATTSSAGLTAASFRFAW